MNTFNQNIGESWLNSASLEVLLISSCLFGDWGLKYTSSRLGDHLWLRAGIDSFTHGIIALFSWALVENSNFDKLKILNCLICALLAICVDLDHFMAAKSFHIKNALSLDERPPFHLTTIIPVICTALWTASVVLRMKPLKTLALIFFTAIFSHHLRDATRRGFWLSPLPSSPTVPYWVYIGVTALTPLLVRYVYTCMVVRTGAHVLHSDKEVEIMIQ